MTHHGNHIADFDKIHIACWTLYVRSGFPKTSIAETLATTQSDGVRGPFTKIPASRFARVSRCEVTFGGRCHKLYFKQYLNRSVWDFVKHLLRPCRAKRALKAAAMLEENGLHSPDIIAMGELNYGPVCVENFLITRELENAHNIYTSLSDNWPELTIEALRDKRAFISELGKTIGRMHAAGIFHGDLRPGNVFAQKLDGSWRFFFLDNERTMKFPVLPRRLRIKNLVQINMLVPGSVTTADRLRFLKTYVSQNPKIKSQVKSLALKVSEKTRQRLERKSPGTNL